MELHEFYQKYANTPLGERGIPLNFAQSGLDTLSTIYKRLHDIGEITRPYDIERAKLLRAVDDYYFYGKR